MSTHSSVSMLEQAIILLADDNSADVIVTQEALRAAHLPNRVHIVTTGQEVIEYLTGAAAAACVATALTAATLVFQQGASLS